MKNNFSQLSIVFVSLIFIISCQSDASKGLFWVDAPQDIITLQKGFYKAKYSHDGSKLLMTDQSNNGLKVYNTQNKNLSFLTRSTDAGLESYFAQNNEDVYFITHDFEEKKRMSSLYVQNITSGARKPIVEGVRNLKLVKTNANVILYYENGILKEYDLARASFNDVIGDHIGVFSDADLNLAVYKNGKAELIHPSGPGSYLWPSMSPQQDKILYTLSGLGTFICDLNGQNLIELGKMNAPNWSPDGKFVIGMDDEDDGQKYIKSNIILVSSDGTKRQNLTLKTDIIATFPILSPDGKKVIFNDDKGMVYEMYLLNDEK